MPLSRRAFLRSVGNAGPAGWVSARGREAWVGAGATDEYVERQDASDALPIRLNSNENPLGPGPAALQAIERATAYAGRYPFNATPGTADFVSLVARRNGLADDCVAIGAGSGEILDCAVRAFTSRARGLVTAIPTFETSTRVARRLNVPVDEVPVRTDGRLDLETMAARAPRAGLVFVCNPNNPTGAVHASSAITELVRRLGRRAPDTIVLVDEAYHDYVTDRSYASAVPLIRQHPNLVISRTLSKAHGMAGLRLGYALGQRAAIARLSRWLMSFNGNVLALAAAMASMQDEAGIERERRRNTEALAFTTRFFREAGFEAGDSQANFAWVNLRRPAQSFAEGCEKRGVLVGRQFPPFEKTHARISIGTMEEMAKAIEVFRAELGIERSAADRMAG